MTGPRGPVYVTVVRRNAAGQTMADTWTIAADRTHELYLFLGEPDTSSSLDSLDNGLARPDTPDTGDL